MIKLIRLEHKKYFRNTVLYFLYSFLLVLVSSIIFEKTGLNRFYIASVIGATMGVKDFYDRYNKEMFNGTLKNSLITPVGRKNVIKAKIIVSIINGLLYCTIAMLGMVMIMHGTNTKVSLNIVLIYLFSAIVSIVATIRKLMSKTNGNSGLWNIVTVLLICNTLGSFFRYKEIIDLIVTIVLIIDLDISFKKGNILFVFPEIDLK